MNGRTDRRTDRQTDRQGQILMPPDYRHGGIKICLGVCGGGGGGGGGAGVSEWIFFTMNSNFKWKIIFGEGGGEGLQ